MLAFYAKMLTACGDERLLYFHPTPEAKQLEVPVLHRHQLIDIRSMEKNRQEQVHSSQVSKPIFEQINVLDKLLEESSKAFDNTIKKFKDIKGIVQNTTTVLMSMLPELSKLSHKQIASLVGVVVPHPKESGNTRYKASVAVDEKQYATPYIWQPLLPFALSQNSKPFTNAYEPMCKVFKAAINAIMCKLLTILNAIVGDSSQWNVYAV